MPASGMAVKASADRQIMGKQLVEQHSKNVVVGVDSRLDYTTFLFDHSTERIGASDAAV